MSEKTRRYDIDWLRVIAIGLLLIYHIAIAFQPWGVFIGFIQSDKSLESIWIPMSMLNVWRIPLLFFVSGMGVCFAIRKRSWKQLLLERSRRILLPLLFGFFTIVPLHVLLWQKYYSQDLTYAPGQSHLWFLANIFIYVLLLSPLFFYLKKNENKPFGEKLKNLFKSPVGLLLVVAMFVLETLVLKPESFSLYAMTLHGYIIGFLAFLFGFIFIYSGEGFWNMMLKWKWPFLSVAAILFIVRAIYFEYQSPDFMMAIESCFWIFAVLGIGFKYLNHPGNALSYLSQGAYPIYILHMIFLYLGSYLIFPLEMPVVLKFILLVLFTVAGCFAMYELIIRRVRFLRTLFGLKSLGGIKK